MSERVTATPAALEVLERLRAQHGPLVVHLSGGCCDGSSPMCLRTTDLPPGPHDLILGELDGTEVVMDRDQDERWGHPTVRLDVGPGTMGGFSLEGLEDLHFTSVPQPACDAPQSE